MTYHPENKWIDWLIELITHVSPDADPDEPPGNPGGFKGSMCKVY